MIWESVSHDAQGLPAGAVRTQTVISPAAASPGQSWESHQKATGGFSQQNKHSPITAVGVGADEMWFNWGMWGWARGKGCSRLTRDNIILAILQYIYLTLHISI